MVTTQEPELKEFLQKSDIRTMEKDLKRLREEDAQREREKIKNLGVPKTPQNQTISAAKANEWIEEKYPAAPTTTPTPSGPAAPSPIDHPKPVTPNITVAQTTKKNTALKVELSPWANEQEKQQLFLLQSQLGDLEHQIKRIGEIEQPALAAKNNATLKEKEQWRQKLDQAVTQEQASGGEQKKEAEKTTWSAQTALAQLEKKALLENEQLRQLDVKKHTLEQEINKINQGITNLLSIIEKRKQTAQKEAPPKETTNQAPTQETSKKPSLKPTEAPTPQEPSEQTTIATPAYAKQLPPTLKEKLEVLQKKEEKQRLKFMEEVEAWANSSDNKKQG